MRIIGICDDDARDSQILADACMEYFNERDISDAKIIQTSSAEEFFMKYEETLTYFNIIFFEIYLKGMSGINAAMKIKNGSIHIPSVIISSSNDFATESYDAGVIDYLVKPVNRDRLFTLLDRIEKKRICPMLVLSGKKENRVPYDDIMYIESKAHKLIVHIDGGAEIISWEKLSDLMVRLDSDSRFLRTAQSFVVNLDKVREVTYEVTMNDGTVIPIRARNRTEIRHRYYQYLTGMLG